MDADLAALLDSLRDRPRADPDADDAALDRLIGGWPSDALASALTPRLDDLSRPDRDVLFRLVEGLSRHDMNEALADALAQQADLDPETRCEALSLLEGTGCIEARPALMEWRSELEELPDEDELFREWAVQIEDDSASIAVQVEALSRIEPDVRAEILDGLQAHAGMAGVARLLRAMREE